MFATVTPDPRQRVADVFDLRRPAPPRCMAVVDRKHDISPGCKIASKRCVVARVTALPCAAIDLDDRRMWPRRRWRVDIDPQRGAVGCAEHDRRRGSRIGGLETAKKVADHDRSRTHCRLHPGRELIAEVVTECRSHRTIEPRDRGRGAYERHQRERDGEQGERECQAAGVPAADVEQRRRREERADRHQPHAQLRCADAEREQHPERRRDHDPDRRRDQRDRGSEGEGGANPAEGHRAGG